MHQRVGNAATATAFALALGFLPPSITHAQSWSLAKVRADVAHRLGYTGNGVLVAVLDSGIDVRHRAFGTRLDERSRGFAQSNPSFIADNDGHGTHVAGIIGAARGVGPMYGVAYGANILALRIVDDNNQQSSAPALQYAAQLRVKVLNGSYGPPAVPAATIMAPSPDNPGVEVAAPNPYYQQLPHQILAYHSTRGMHEDLPEAQGMEAAANADVLMVFAAGNEYEEQPLASANPSGSGLIPFIRPQNHAANVYRFIDTSKPGTDQNNPNTYAYLAPNAPELATIDYSHLQDALIVVVATDNDNRISSYSNRCGVAWRWCMAAPGGENNETNNPPATEGILSSVPGNRYGVMVGTSMAAPLVAGSAAVVRGAFPYLTARQTIEIMLTTTDATGHLADRAIYGRGLLDLGRAIMGPREFGAVGFPRIFDVDTQGYDSIWSGDITGSGGLNKRGAGNLILKGVNSYRGGTRVTGGRLTVLGSTIQSSFDVRPGATLAGTGAVGPTIMAGTIEPGQRVHQAGSAAEPQLRGTMAVIGDYTHRPSGTLVSAISADGTSNRLDVAGTVALQGGTLAVQGISPSTLGQRYSLIHATQGIRGDFAVKPGDYAFIDLTTRIEGPGANRYTLSVDRKDGGFGIVAHDANQRAVAAALDNTPSGGPIVDTLLMTREAATARTTLTQLAGDIHPGVLGALTQQGALTRDTVISRLRQANPSFAAPADQGQRAQAVTIWGQHISDWGRLAANGSANSLRTTYHGVLLGGDAAVGRASRLGVAAGFGQSTLQGSTSMTRAEVDNYTISAFGSTAWSATQWRYGITHGWHNVDSRRHVGIAPQSRVETRYNARTAQFFTELGHRQNWSQIAIEPFANLTYARALTSGFNEPGVAGLHGARSTHNTWFTTLGTRLDTHWALPRHGTVALQGSIGWRHAMGSLTPTTTMQLPGSPAFSIAGAAPARNAAVLEAGLQWQPTLRAGLGVAYVGQLASGARNHGVQARASWQF